MILNTGSGYNDTRNQIDHFTGKSIKYTCNKNSVLNHLLEVTVEITQK